MLKVRVANRRDDLLLHQTLLHSDTSFIALHRFASEAKSGGLRIGIGEHGWQCSTSSPCLRGIT